MKEKLLAALKSKFPGVKDATLDRIATNKAGTVTDEGQVQSIIDGVTVDTIIDSESDYRASQEAKSASKKAVTDYESKHKLKDGKTIESTKKDPDPKDPKKGGDGAGDEKVPAWAQQLIKDSKEMGDRLSQQEKDRETSDKQSQAKELLKGSKIPEKLREKWLKRIDVNDEDTSLGDQVKELETEYLDLKQEHINSSEDGEGGQQGGETSESEIGGYLDDKFGSAEGEKK
jgi:hypothetical protein